jgi:polysaccharide pyruvyl transferase WcaK-like protein
MSIDLKSEIYSLPVNARIGVFGHYGNTNIGDEAIIQAVIQNIKKRRPQALIACFSLRPEDSAIRHEVMAFPIRKEISAKQDIKDQPLNIHFDRLKQLLKSVPIFFRMLKAVYHIVEILMQVFPEILFIYRSFKILKSFDLLLIAGSNQFMDNFGGVWLFPYDLLKWTVLAKLARTKVYYISVGAGPINSKLSCLFIRLALKFADYVSYRDVASKELIRQTGFRGNAYVYPDLAHSLILENHQPSNRGPRSASQLPTVGINPMPLFDSRYWYATDDQIYFAYIQKLASFASRLMLKGYTVFFFSTQCRDEDVIDDIINLLEKNPTDKVGSGQIKRKSPSVGECIANILNADIIVASRFHGTVLSLIVEKPVLAISYWRKTRDVMREMGQEDYVVDFDNITLEDMWKCFKKLESNYCIEIEKIKAKTRAYRLMLDEQYNLLFTPEVIDH